MLSRDRIFGSSKRRLYIRSCKRSTPPSTGRMRLRCTARLAGPSNPRRVSRYTATRWMGWDPGRLAACRGSPTSRHRRRFLPGTRSSWNPYRYQWSGRSPNQQDTPTARRPRPLTRLDRASASRTPARLPRSTSASMDRTPFVPRYSGGFSRRARGRRGARFGGCDRLLRDAPPEAQRCGRRGIGAAHVLQRAPA
jgi:hypothetical protein